MPSNYFEGQIRTFEAGSAIATKGLRVDFAADGAIDPAGATEIGIGTANRIQNTVGGDVPVRLFSSSGTFELVASAAISRGDKLQASASGKVATLATGTAINMRALSAAAADGDIIEAVKII